MNERRLAAGAVLVATVTMLLACGGGRGSGGASATPVAPAAGTVPFGAAVAPARKATVKRVQGTLRTPDGRDRTYTVYVPSSLPRGRAAPLLIGLHGALGWGAQFEHESGYDGLAEANHFIAVYPDGTKIKGVPQGRVWNAGSCCAAASGGRDDVDDVGFISQLVATLRSSYAIDPARVFVTGHSNGAMLGLRLACELADRIDAVAVQSGALLVAGCRPSRPIAVMEIHGTADATVPIDGGQSRRHVPGTDTDFPPTFDAIHTLTAADACPGDPPQTSADRNNAAVTYQVWRRCAGGTLVEWAKVEGAGHNWMGHRASPTEEALVGAPYMGVDASVATWSFLAANARR